MIMTVKKIASGGFARVRCTKTSASAGGTHQHESFLCECRLLAAVQELVT